MFKWLKIINQIYLNSLYQNIKKYLLQNLFPEEDKNVPKIRFPEFKDKWHLYTYNNLSKFIESGKSHEKIVSEGKYKIYGSRGLMGMCSNYDYDGTYLIIARVGANAGSVYLINDMCCISDNTLVIKHNSLINYYFSLYYLIQYNFDRIIIGSGRPLITGKDVKRIKIKIPSIKEQKKIVEVIKIMDSTLNYISIQIDNLKEFKKGLLQKMFV